MKWFKYKKVYFSSVRKSWGGHGYVGKVIKAKTKKCERKRRNNGILPRGGHLHFLLKSPETCDRNRNPGSRRSQVLASRNPHYFLCSAHYFNTLCILGLLGDVKATEHTFVHGNLGPARRCPVGGSQKGNQSSVNILQAITPCWTLPNTFMGALGKVFLYQHASSGHCYNDM